MEKIHTKSQIINILQGYIDETYTQSQIEQAFLQWYKDWHLNGRLDTYPEEKDFPFVAKKDAEYLIHLMNDAT